MSKTVLTETGPVEVDDMEFIPVVSRVDLKPGDRLVLNYPGALPQEAYQHLKRLIEEWAPECKVLILCEGVTLTVVGKEEAGSEQA